MLSSSVWKNSLFHIHSLVNADFDRCITTLLFVGHMEALTKHYFPIKGGGAMNFKCDEESMINNYNYVLVL
jgi:hypothetical protein